MALPYWTYFIWGHLLFWIVAWVLRVTRKRWYGKFLGWIALGGVLLAVGVIAAMLTWGTGIPLNLPPMELLWWFFVRCCLMFLVTALPILILDSVTVNDDHISYVERLRKQYDADMQELREALTTAYTEIGRLNGRQAQ